MVKWYAKIVFSIFCIVTTQQTSFGMLSRSGCLHIGWNLGAAGLKSVQPNLLTLNKMFESQRTLQIGSHLSYFYNCLNQMTHQNKIFFKNYFLLTFLYNLIYHHCKIDSMRIQRAFFTSPYFIHTCATSLKRSHILPETIFAYLPNSFAVLSTESQLGDTKLLNPFHGRETLSVVTNKILVQILFFVVSAKNPVLTHPVALHFKNISHDLFSESWWKSHLCLSTCLNIVPSQPLDQCFQARQYIWLTLTVLSCLGIQGTENRILYDWKYWLLVGTAHTIWFNRMEKLNHFDKHGRIPASNNLAKRYATLLKAYWIPIVTATVATFFETYCA